MQKHLPSNDAANKILIDHLLLEGRYLRRVEFKKYTGYVLYKDNQDPVRKIKDNAVKPVGRLLKIDRGGRMTLNLSAVRQENGNSYVKRRYKNLPVRGRKQSVRVKKTREQPKEQLFLF